ncbi:MAG TPA: succinate dehydrogenase, hydrophobic membrane anchor protein [Sneathiellales bacterium]|jgi:succinate dehydrogenase / fumarate reductase membrane anchor subunit|nr:succinate dehydrogenase, hydrophobic membrane anchor protein [Sneathiellales bacterium]
MGLRTPLGQVRGLGSAKEGTNHFWLQRLTAIALIPLSVWFVASITCLAGADHNQVVDWLSSPITSVCMILMLGTTFFHLKLGVQVVIEDYVHSPWAKTGALIGVTFFCFVLGLASILAVLKLAVGG